MESKPQEKSLLDQIKRRFVYGLIFGVAVIIAVTLFADGPALFKTLQAFDWRLLLPILFFTVANYALRFGKWHLYLRWLEVGAVQVRTSLGIFLAGLSMAITPGKVGEFLKSYLLRRVTGTPMSVTAPIIVAERLTDGLAMLILASLGFLTVSYGWQMLVGVAVVAVVAVIILQRRTLVLSLLGKLERVQLIAGRIHTLETLYESMYVLLKPANLLPAVGIGVISWWGESIAFFLILVGLGIPASVDTLLIGTFILASATILGALSMLPGGLGATEAGVAGLLLILFSDPGMTPDVAAAATLLVRFATLWFGVLLGLGALLGIERHVSSIERSTSLVAQSSD